MRLPNFIRNVAGGHAGEHLIRQSLSLGALASPRATERFLSLFGRYESYIEEEQLRLITSVPTETTLKERRFLYRYFSDHWSGLPDVVEIGPFLGGTTAAIAMGMMDNPRRLPQAELVTYDRFASYRSSESLRELLRPLVEVGRIGKNALPDQDGEVNFLSVFTSLHSGTPYEHLIKPVSAPVPDRSSDLNSEDPFLTLSNPLSAVFVDGCKSWYATKYFMKESLPLCEPGTPVFFQDYTCRTCFWVSSFVELLQSKFRLFAHADDTYAFILTERVNANEVEENFPDDPSLLDPLLLTRLYDLLIARDEARADEHAAFVHALHKIGALAYVGRKEEARRELAVLQKRRLSRKHRRLLHRAHVSPTYSPDGLIYLGRDPVAEGLEA